MHMLCNKLWKELKSSACIAEAIYYELLCTTERIKRANRLILESI